MSKVLSVIIPTRNVMETGKLKEIFDGLMRVDDMGSMEVLVCDFESNDGLKDLVAQYDFVKLLECLEGGTARQINYGLSQASGEYVLIHHARSLISDYNLVLDLCKKSEFDWMFFPLKFDCDHWLLKYFVAPLSTYLRPGLKGAIYWDQCNLIRRELCEEVGRVPVMDLMEDTEFSRRLHGTGLKPKLIKDVGVVTSAHRFVKNGIYTQYWRNMYIKTAHWRGWKSVDELNELYK